MKKRVSVVYNHGSLLVFISKNWNDVMLTSNVMKKCFKNEKKEAMDGF